MGIVFHAAERERLSLGLNGFKQLGLGNFPGVVFEDSLIPQLLKGFLPWGGVGIIKMLRKICSLCSPWSQQHNLTFICVIT